MSVDEARLREVRAPGPPTALALRIGDWLVLLTLLGATWLKLAFARVGDLPLDDLLMLAATGWIAGERIARRDGRVARQAVALGGLGLAMLAVYLAGFTNVSSDLGLTQYAKSLASWSIHMTFAVACTAHLAARGPRLYWRALRWFGAGMLVNAAYAALQLVLQYGTGTNPDKLWIAPLFGGAPTGGATLIGAVTQVSALGTTTTTSVLRATGLTVDPNHLGVMLSMPIAIGTALLLGGRSQAIARHRTLLGVLIGACLLGQALTQSRSGVLATLAAFAVLGVVYRRRLASRSVLVPVAVVAVVLGGIALAERGYVQRVVEARLETSSTGSQIHTQLFGEIPTALQDDPLLGIGLNQFPIRFSFDTDRATLFGAHSYVVATVTETGIVGTAVALALLLWLLVQALELRARANARPVPEDDRPALAWGLVAALAATLAGNIFYLTMVHNSWFALVALVAAAPAALAGDVAPAPTRAAPAPSPGLAD